MSGFYYNSNGFAFHRIDDAVRILADLGYDGLALTPDVHHLDPFHVTAREVEAFRSLLDSLGLGIVIETGARFVLDARRKHRPSLLDSPDEAEQRLKFLQRCVELGQDLGAPVVTVWSGSGPGDLPEEVAQARLVSGLRRLCDSAAERGVRVGFEPEPGMAVQRASEWPALRDAVDHEAFGLTLDVGHCLAMSEGLPEEAIRAHAADLLVVQLDDHRRGRHDHLAFGEGELDFEAVASALSAVHFEGPLEVELSRHSATAPRTATDSLAFLRDVFSP